MQEAWNLTVSDLWQRKFTLTVLCKLFDGLSNTLQTPSPIPLIPTAPLVSTPPQTGCMRVHGALCQIYGPVDSFHLRERWGKGKKQEKHWEDGNVGQGKNEKEKRMRGFC